MASKSVYELIHQKQRYMYTNYPFNLLLISEIRPVWNTNEKTSNKPKSKIATECMYFKVRIFWEGHRILRNLHLNFVLCTASQILVEISQNFVAFSENMNFIQWNIFLKLRGFNNVRFLKRWNHSSINIFFTSNLKVLSKLSYPFNVRTHFLYYKLGLL